MMRLPGRRRMIRRGLRRTRRRIRRTRRILRGTAVLLAFGAGLIKLRKDDVDRIEAETGRPAEDLSEEELRAAMKKLGIQRLEIDAGDEAAVDEAEDD